MAMLLTNKLAPVAINNFPPTHQTLWLYNPYSTDIKLKLITYDEKLSFINDVIVVKSHEHLPILIRFTPNILGSFDVGFLLIINFNKN